MSKSLSQAFEEARRELPPKEQERCAHLMSEAVREHRSSLAGKTVPKGKWARIAERFASEAPLTPEAAEDIRQFSRRFREEFAFRHDLDEGR